MLVLSRKLNDEIVIEGDIRIKVISITGNAVRLGIEAPQQIAIVRSELLFEDADQERSTRQGQREFRSTISR